MPKKPTKNPAAVALGKQGKGRRKRLSPAALEQRRTNAAMIKLARQQARDDTHFTAPVMPDWDDDE